MPVQLQFPVPKKVDVTSAVHSEGCPNLSIDLSQADHKAIQELFSEIEFEQVDDDIQQHLLRPKSNSGLESHSRFFIFFDSGSHSYFSFC
jgi:hypothetical protein